MQSREKNVYWGHCFKVWEIPFKRSNTTSFFFQKNYIFLCVGKLHYESGSQAKPFLSSCQSLGYIVLSKTATLNQLLNLYIRADWQISENNEIILFTKLTERKQYVLDYINLFDI